jgi:hypothetical protein
MIKYIPGNEWEPGDKVAQKAAMACQRLTPEGIDYAIRWGTGKLGGRTLVLDLGWFKRSWNAFMERPNGYYQIGVNHICWLPPEPMPSDRWERLGLTIEPPRDPGDNVLAIGQVEYDAQHGLSYSEMHQWMKGKRERFRYRPHPQGDEGRPERSLDEDLEWADSVLTYNSTVGLEALRRGLPVTSSTNCFFRDLCNRPCPSVEERLTFFSRVAYAQWTEKEIEDGDFVKFYLPFVR